MRSGRLLFALLVGLLLTVAAVGAWTGNSQGAAAPPGCEDGTVARISIVIDGVEVAAFSDLEGIRSGYEIEASS